jgi:hypothetical protein
MERSQRTAVLLSLIAQLQSRGSWCGETHIQKTAYFLQELLGVPLAFDFVLYIHGPVSFDLADEITAMQCDQLLGVVVRDPLFEPRLLPSQTSQNFLARFPLTRQRYEHPIRFVAERLARKNVAELERLATALFVSRMPDAPADPTARALKISQLKPHIQPEQARAAVLVVDRMSEEAKEATVP